MSELQPFARPELTHDEQLKAVAVANKIARHFNVARRLDYVLVIVNDNIRLLKEVQQHRAARGLEPLETYPIDASRI